MTEHPIVSTPYTHTLEPFTELILAHGGDGDGDGDGGGGGGDGDGGGGGIGSVNGPGSPNMMYSYVSAAIHFGGGTLKNLRAMFSAISSAPSAQSAG